MNNTVLPPADLNSEQLTGLSMVEWAVALRERRLTAVECLELHFERIARDNPGLNAIVTLNPLAQRKRRPPTPRRPRAGSLARCTASRSR